MTTCSDHEELWSVVMAVIALNFSAVFFWLLVVAFFKGWRGE